MEIHTPRSLIHSSKGCTYKLCKKKKVATASGYVNMYMWMFLLQKKNYIYRCNFMCFPSLADKAINHFNNLLEANTHFAKVFAPHSLFTQSKIWYIEWLACLLFLFKLKIEIHIFYVNFIWYSMTLIFSVQEINLKKPHRIGPRTVFTSHIIRQFQSILKLVMENTEGCNYWVNTSNV